MSRDGAEPLVRRLTVDPEPLSVRRARHELEDWLDGQGRADGDVAALLLSELLTNVVLHARTTATVRIELDGPCLRVSVTDGARSLPAPQRPASDAVTGRGLLIVDALADGWGVESTAGGKSVWFELTEEPRGTA